MKKVKDSELKKIMTYATCSSADEPAINEVLKRQEVQNVLREERSAKELNLVEDLLYEISKHGAAAYGLKDVKKASEAGAVEKLLISDGLIQDKREKGEYDEVEQILRQVDKAKGEIIIITSDNEGGKKLDGLKGIGAILRYKMDY